MTAAIARHRWGCLSALVAAVAAIAFWVIRPPAVEALREHPYFAITQLVITGCGPALSVDDVRGWLGFSGTTTVWDAAPARVRERLLEHPRIESATARRVFPDRLEVVIRERRPQAIAVLDDLYYVDRSGATFGPLAPEDSRDYPILTGIDAADATGARSWLVRRALRLLRRCDRQACIGEISEVHLDAARGVVVYPAAPRLPIVLGWGSWPVKLERAQRALRAWNGGVERLASLDVRFHNQVVLTLQPTISAPPFEKGGSGGISHPRRGQNRPPTLPPFFEGGDLR